MNVNFKKWAKHRDLDQTVGHAPHKKIGVLRLPKIPNKDHPIELKAANGLVVEDAHGIPLIYHLMGVFKPHFNEISVGLSLGDEYTVDR